MKKETGYLQFQMWEQEVIYYTINKNTYHYPTFNSFLLSPSQTRDGCRVFLKDDIFNAVMVYLEQNNYNVKKVQIHGNGKIVCISIKFPNENYNKTFYSLKYKTGTDEYESVDEILNQIEDAPSRMFEGYTSKLRKILTTNEQKQDFTITSAPSLSPMIYAKLNKEYKNVKCFDATSFYPFLLTQELPHFDKEIDFNEMDMNDNRYTYYGGIRIKNIKAKTFFYPLSLYAENGVVKKQGQNIVCSGTSLVQADEVILYGFLPFLWEELQDYNYSDIIFTRKIFRFNLYPDEKISQEIQRKFAIKQAKKRAGEYYLPEKILLNRCYGYFITKGSDTPAHYGQYIVAKGKTILRRLALEIGLKDVIHMHTDSIKFVGDHEDVIERYNMTVPFEELGKFAYEGTMEQVIYYQKNVAKYIENGKLKFKHGGINEQGIRPLYRLGYDNIDKDTDVFIIIGYEYNDKDGFTPLVIKRKLGGVW